MESYDPRKDLRALWRFVQERWWIVLVCALAGGAAGLAVTSVKEREYEASATLLVQADPLEKLVGLSEDFSSVGDPTLPGSDVETRIQLVRQRSVAAGVKRKLRSGRTVSALLERVRAERDTTTSLIRIVARESSAGGAARLANAWSAELVRDAAARQRRRIGAATALLRRELRARSGVPAVREVLSGQLARLTTLRAMAPRPLRVVTPAVGSDVPVSPRRAVAASMGLLVGFVIGLGVALVRHLGLREALRGPRAPKDVEASA